jgi:RimJ/RimL family protein N-acetyltransferase
MSRAEIQKTGRTAAPCWQTAGVELPTLAGDGLVLRPMRANDVDAVVEACADPEIVRWTLVPSPYTRADGEGYLAHSAQVAREGTSANLLAFDPAGRLLGSFSLMGIDRDRRVAEIGYWVAAGARRRGVATRAVRLLADWGFETLELEAIEILCHEDNLASRAVAARAGFTPTGERRGHPRAEEAGPPRHLVHLRRADSRRSSVDHP